MITASDERTDRLTRLRAAAYRIRRRALEMAEVQGQGYIGQALGVADILAVLYADQLRFRPDDPDWSERDRFLLSTGHYAIALYAALAEAGVIGEDELQTYGTDDSRLPISSMATYTPGVEISGGSLGHGLPIAIGVALGLRHQGNSADSGGDDPPTPRRDRCPGVHLPVRRRTRRRIHLGGSARGRPSLPR
jgi:transketolase